MIPFVHALILVLHVLFFLLCQPAIEIIDPVSTFAISFDIANCVPLSQYIAFVPIANLRCCDKIRLIAHFRATFAAKNRPVLCLLIRYNNRLMIQMLFL